MSSEYQYSKVSECVWFDAGFQGLSLDARYVWFYLLTNPARKSMGVYRMPVAGMAAESGMEEARFRAALSEVVAAGMVGIDEQVHVVVIWKYLVHNRPANGNMVRHWKAMVRMLPECALVDAYLQWVSGYLEGLGEGFSKAFVDACGNRFGNGIGNGIGNGTPTLLTLNSYLKTPLTPLEGGTAGEGEEREEGEGNIPRPLGTPFEGGHGNGQVAEGEGTGGEHRRDAGGTLERGGGNLRQDAAATEGLVQGNIPRPSGTPFEGGHGREAELEAAVGASRRARGRRSGVEAGEDPLAGLPVLAEAHGVFRERLEAVHGARATLGPPGEERAVLARLVREGFEQRDVVAVLKWVLWEEPAPSVPGGFCWRDQFRSFRGLVKPMRSGEMKFKGMAAGYEAWARSLGGVSVRAHGRGVVVGGQGSGVGEAGAGEVVARRWVAG